MNHSLDIISIGECMIELSTQKSLSYAEIFHKYYGGDTINTTITAARLGSKVGYITKLGNDFFKDFLLESWQAENIDTNYVKLVDGHNGLYFISKQENQDKQFACYRKKTAATTLSIDDIPEEYIKRAGIVYSTGITQSLSDTAYNCVKKAFSIAKENGILTAYDPNYRPRLWSIGEAREAVEDIIEYIDMIFLNDIQDANTIYGISSPDKIIKYFWDKGVSTVIVKQGKSGSTIGYNGEIIHIPSCINTIVDTTGAGDAYNGGFLHGISEGYTPFEAAKLACIVSGKQIEGLGSVRSIPHKEHVYEEFKKGEIN